MIGLDTNVLARYFARDHEDQFTRSRSLIRALNAERPGLISLVVLAELSWVMRSNYRLKKAQLVEMLEMLTRMDGFVLEEAETVKLALDLFAKCDADFADCLIERSAAKSGCDYTFTFDDQAARGAGMRLIP